MKRMRRKENVNNGWYFLKESDGLPLRLPAGAPVLSLPHTWNAQDGQDGGNNYHKGTCYYVKEMSRPAGDRIYLEFEGANSIAGVYVNGQKAAYHEGGYSTFRADITELLTEDSNIVTISVDNSIQSHVYPQMADFTFYGGLYRNVNIITVPDSHFDLAYYGGEGLTAEAAIKGKDAVLTLHAYITKPEEGQCVEFCIRDREGTIRANVSVPAAGDTEAKVILPDAHLWQGVEDPYLYTVTAILLCRNETIDEVSIKTGIREFTVDPQKGFFLNGKSMPLRGVSRHQDRLGAGNALTKAQHYEDAEIIRELGANTVRLAHYQHSQYFYDACDELGLIVWAEIPFISVMSEDPKAHDNCVSQMKELIIQNYNHASILFWGIANEITIGGEKPDLIANLKDLDRLVHEMDKTRLSTIAHVSMVPMESEMNRITDILSYNHYFGWYGGKMEDNEAWLDAFHAKHPDRALGVSEYGAEGIIAYHGEDPKVRDYSEDYQALYHEHMAQVIADRPWIWSTHVWNMFDFGCDARDEGGVKGRNNKGLVTLDRKFRKDSFYVYKAFWSKEAFVRLAGHRYSMRTGDSTTIKVYSNLPEVTLYVNGEEWETQKGNKIFLFGNVPLAGCTMLVAKAEGCSDAMTVYKTEASNPSYLCPQQEEEDGDGVANWFNLDDFKEIKPLEFREGYFSIRDKIGEIMANEEAGDILVQAFSAATGMKLKKAMLGMMKDMTLEGMTSMMSGMQSKSTKKPEELVAIINDLLNKIKK